MSAVLQLINDPTIVESEEIMKSDEAASEQLLEDNMHLRAEIRTLCEELARAERTLATQKALLSNARIREFELRAELSAERR